MDPTQNNATQTTPVATTSSSPAQPAGPSFVKPPVSGDGSGKRFSNFPSWAKPLYIVIAACFLLLAVALLWLFAFNKGEKRGFLLGSEPTPTPAVKTVTTISGNVLFQGYAPPDAYIVIAERSKGEGEYKSVITNLAPSTGAI